MKKKYSATEDNKRKSERSGSSTKPLRLTVGKRPKDPPDSGKSEQSVGSAKRPKDERVKLR